MDTIKSIYLKGILNLIKNINNEDLINFYKNFLSKKEIEKKCRNEYKLTKIIGKEVNLLADF